MSHNDSSAEMDNSIIICFENKNHLLLLLSYFPNDGEKSLLKAEIPGIATSKHLSPIRKKIDCNMNRLSYGWSKLCAVRVHFPMIVQNVKGTVKVVFLQLFLT